MQLNLSANLATRFSKSNYVQNDIAVAVAVDVKI